MGDSTAQDSQAQVVLAHYEGVLGPVYSWMLGGWAAKHAQSREFFARHQITPRLGGFAVDLGSGPGFQAVALAQAGFQVLAVDLSPTLLAELRGQAVGWPVQAVEGDLLAFQAHLPGPAELVVCLGDTLTHLPDAQAVQTLFGRAHAALEPGGRLLLTYRDLSPELQGAGRFIPVKSDENTVFTCFLEYHPDVVHVYDLVYTRQANGWTLTKGHYPKLRLPMGWTVKALENVGFTLQLTQSEGGMVTLLAQKS